MSTEAESPVTIRHGGYELELQPRDQERFWETVDQSGMCWEWRGLVADNGYGKFATNGRRTLAHRVSYQLICGPIPTGLVLDHLCCNKSCVNPEHLEPVTTAENNRRGGPSRGRRPLEPEEILAEEEEKEASHDRADRMLETLAGIATVLLTVASFGLSYTHLAHVAQSYGMGSVAGWVWPATIDSFIIVGELLVLRASLRGGRDWFAYTLTVIGSLGSVALNVAGVGAHMLVMNYVVAAVPPVAALLAFAALMRGVRARLSTEATEAVDPLPVHPVPETVNVHPETQVNGGEQATPELPPAPTYRPSTPRIGVDTKPRERLSTEQADVLIREAWVNGEGVRSTAARVTRSPSFVSRRFKELAATEGK